MAAYAQLITNQHLYSACTRNTTDLHLQFGSALAVIWTSLESLGLFPFQCAVIRTHAARNVSERTVATNTSNTVR